MPTPMPKKPRTPIANIHAHSHIFRDRLDESDEPVTFAEQIAAIERFVRWHERQVAVGRELLASLLKESPHAAHALADAPPSGTDPAPARTADAGLGTSS